jgi:hypothetical protein
MKAKLSIHLPFTLYVLSAVEARPFIVGELFNNWV